MTTLSFFNLKLFNSLVGVMQECQNSDQRCHLINAQLQNKELNEVMSLKSKAENGLATKWWGEKQVKKFPISMQPYHVAQKQMLNDNVTKTREQFIKTWPWCMYYFSFRVMSGVRKKELQVRLEGCLLRHLDALHISKPRYIQTRAGYSWLSSLCFSNSFPSSAAQANTDKAFWFRIVKVYQKADPMYTHLILCFFSSNGINYLSGLCTMVWR